MARYSFGRGQPIPDDYAGEIPGFGNREFEWEQWAITESIALQVSIRMDNLDALLY